MKIDKRPAIKCSLAPSKADREKEGGDSMCRRSCRSSFQGILATAALLVLSLILTTGFASAQVPSDCNRNCLHIDSIAPDRFVTLNHEHRTWDFVVSNEDTAGSSKICCEA